MVMTRLTAPAAEPVTLAEAKAHLRVTTATEDALIVSLIAAAREEVEVATGLALISQNWRIYLDHWPHCNVLKLNKHPVQSVLQVTVYDALGAPTTIIPVATNLDRASRPARFAKPDAIGSPGQPVNGIEIDIRTGFGETGVEVPDGLKRAILLLMAFWFEHRGTGQTAKQDAIWPDGYERIIARYRHLEL